jgi:hypothetical protein
VQRGADHPTDVVSEIQEGKLKIKSVLKKVHKNASPENESVLVAEEGNDVVNQTSKLENKGEDSDVGEDGTNGGEEGADVTKKGNEAGTGEKRQRPIGIPEKEPQHVEEYGEEVQAENPEAKKSKKEVQEEKPVKTGRQAKTSARTKIQTAETTATKKRGVGRPRKSKKETRAEVIEFPVETMDDVQAATANPVN